MASFFDKIGEFLTVLVKPHKWFDTPKVTLPTIELPKQRVQAPLPVVKPPKKPKIPGQTGDISSFSSNLTPTIRAILGLSVPKVSPGLLIPGAPSE